MGLGLVPHPELTEQIDRIAEPPLAPNGQGATPGQRTPENPDEVLDFVTLDQAAAMVNRSKRTLERYKTKGTLPVPAVEGGGGRADRWNWKTMGPWLEKEFGIKLPTTFPANHRT